MKTIISLQIVVLFILILGFIFLLNTNNQLVQNNDDLTKQLNTLNKALKSTSESTAKLKIRIKTLEENSSVKYRDLSIIK